MVVDRDAATSATGGEAEIEEGTGKAKSGKKKKHISDVSTKIHALV